LRALDAGLGAVELAHLVRLARTGDELDVALGVGRALADGGGEGGPATDDAAERGGAGGRCGRGRGGGGGDRAGGGGRGGEGGGAGGPEQLAAGDIWHRHGGRTLGVSTDT